MLAVVAALALAQAPSPWEREVVYQIFPRSFHDSNGDRIGDLNGITQKLGYLQALGATTILLNPIAASPNYHNYFADDFFRVDAEFGTERDLRQLVTTAHRKGIKVLLDMEPQYVTDRHPWLRAFTANPAAPEKDYLWTVGSWLWGTRIPWYDGADVRVAAINPHHPAVRDHVRDAFLKWARLGIDGFRIDHMMDDLDNKGMKTGLLTTFWRPILAEVRLRYPRTFFVAEQGDWGFGREHFAKADVDAVYATVIWDAIKSQDARKLNRAIGETSTVTPERKTQFLFVENHDVDRFATIVGSEASRMRTGAVVAFTLKGTPCVYYGQELGMRGRKGPWKSDGSDIPMRLAFEWSRKREAPGSALWYANSGPWWSDEFARSDDGISLEEQKGRPDSTFEFYRRLIRLRRGEPTLREGSQRLIDPQNPDLVAFERQLGRRRVLVLANFSANAHPYSWPADRDLWTGKPFTGAITVPPHGFRILARTDSTL
ncbi:MAG: alpha-amylase family glycosyl hydrolase [Fimbriimonas sp.]